MAYALQPPVTIPKGSKIAQIIAFENLLGHRQCPRKPTELQREDSFGSTGHDVFFTLDFKKRPMKKVQLQHGFHCIQLKLMLDTGSNVSIVNLIFWPPDWPLQALSNHIVGVGRLRIPLISKDPISIIFEDNQGFVAQPYVMTLPIQLAGLIGGDVLSQLSMVLTTNQHFP
ncbi:hypothetical protein HGM15179_021698 [Zosterops borbonicus]|uniref:Peptidase A2 domain-containing protein n=1 Tax=Zosterops borbonicus TaxID=364589 RepID=A0A8K1FWX2_9PASS|nr:hypothetical protein HGM15179_021698 [Zosterops borbonicus]